MSNGTINSWRVCLSVASVRVSTFILLIMNTFWQGNSTRIYHAMVKKSTTPKKWLQCIFHGPGAHHDSALNFLQKLFTITIIVIYLSYCSLSPVPWYLPATDHTIISTWQYVWYSCALFSIWYMVTSNGSFFFIFMQLAGKFGRIIGWQPPLLGLTLPPPNKMKFCWNSGGFMEREKFVKISCFVVCPPPSFCTCWHELHFLQERGIAGPFLCKLFALQLTLFLISHLWHCPAW